MKIIYFWVFLAVVGVCSAHTVLVVGQSGK